LVADRNGRPRHDFAGKLAFSWPRSAAQTRLNVGQPGYDPLFAYGYGRSYRDRGEVPKLSEEAGVGAAQWNVDKYFISGRTRAPWSLSLRPTPAVLSSRAIDAGGIQEGGRQLSWNGKGEGTAALVGSGVINLARQTNADLLLQIEYRVDEKPTDSVQLAMTCGRGCVGTLDLTPVLVDAAPAQWRTLKVRLAAFAKAGADMSRIVEPFVISTNGRLGLSLQAVRLTSDPTGTISLPAAQR
ncbi:MAG: putative glycoside hydrolase, partial [Steroidobacteraceae bacterium]